MERIIIIIGIDRRNLNEIEREKEAARFHSI